MQQGKAQLTKATLAKHTRTPGTGPSPLSAKPAQGDSRPASTSQKPSPVSGRHAAPNNDTKTKQEPAHKSHSNALGQDAVGKRLQVYWDGEKAWWVTNTIHEHGMHG